MEKTIAGVSVTVNEEGYLENPAQWTKEIAAEIAKEEGIAERGYRLVTNTGKEGGQVVLHLHLHLLGGKKLDVPRYQ